MKQWGSLAKSLDYFQEIIDGGLSLAVYKGTEMVGFALLSHYKWNNSFWIENFRVSQHHQRRGIGNILMEAVRTLAHENHARLVGLETQSTNFPAIQFYKQCGFEISGIDSARYPQFENDLTQVAILMKRDVPSAFSKDGEG